MTAAVLNVLLCAAFGAETKLVISGRRPEPEVPGSARAGTAPARPPWMAGAP